MKRTKQKTNHLIRMVALLAMLLVGVNVSWGQLLPTTRYSLDNVGTNSFALVNVSEGKALYGTGNQDLAYGSYADAFADQTRCFEFKLKEVNGHYLLHAYLHNGDEYSIWGGTDRYLNSQSNSGGVSFILGLTGNNNEHSYGQDGDNLALWDLESDGNGGYKLKNVGTGKYLNNAGAATNDNGVSWSLCSLGEGCTVSFYANPSAGGTVTATVNGEEITSGTKVPYGTNVMLTANPNSGYVFKNWSNGETGLTRTWAVTANGNPSANFEAAGEGYAVTFGPNTVGWGTVTAKRLDTNASINSGDRVPSGTQVQFTATASSSEYLVWGWNVDGADNWTFPNPYTVTKDVTVIHKFTPGIKLSAINTNGAYGNVNISGGDKNGTNIHVTPWAGDITFQATPKTGGQFEGWFYDVNCTNPVTAIADKIVIEGNNVIFKNGYIGLTGDEEQNGKNFNLWGKFTAVPKKTIEKLKCNHYAGSDGNNQLDISQLNANTGATCTINNGVATVTTSSSQGSVSFHFNEACNLTDLAGWTISNDETVRSHVTGIEFLSGTTSLQTFNNNAGNRTLSNSGTDAEAKAKLKNVTEIRIHFAANTESTFGYVNFKIEHADHSARPQLTEGTQEYMQIFTGEDLILANNAGFWRQYSDNTFTNDKIIDTLIPTNEWKPKYVISASNLTQGQDYYFGVKDDMTCALGYNHHSELVGVHVKVVEPIKTVDVNGTQRQYDVYAPEGISGNVGVIISLHGANNDYYNGRVDFNDIADANKDVEGKKFVVVYPRGLNHQEIWGGARSWESYDEASSNDTEFFKTIVKKINEDSNGLTVDKTRIYLAGFSNGGMMAYKAAHKDGDFYAACASVGGFPVNESHLWHAGSRPVPFVHIHGTNDNVVRIKESGDETVYNVETIRHNMVYRNGAKFNSWAEDGNEKQDGGLISEYNNSGTKVVEKDCHAAEAGGAAYYYYEISGMWHTASKDWTGDGVDDVASTMWAFFNKSGIRNNVDKTLKFRVYDENTFMDNAKGCGFDVVNEGKTVIAYGKNKTNNDKNIYHSLQFAGTGSGTPHYLRLNMETEVVANSTDYFLVSLTKYGDSNPVFAKRYQAGKGKKDLYINFTAPNGVNEYRLVVTKSSETLDVKVNRVEFHSGMCEDNNSGVEETEVFFTDVRTLLGLSEDKDQRKLNPIYQPVYGQTYDALTKEYLPIATITVPTIEKVEEDNRDTRTLHDVLKYTNAGETQATTISSITGSTTSDATEKKLYVNMASSSKDTNNSSIKSKNVVILGNETSDAYPIDNTNGINISHYGRAMMPEYINGTRGDFPTHGVMAMQIEGTLDFTMLAYNVNGTDANRRVLKVYYTNDQLNSEIRELKEWDFFGTRNEDGTSYGQQLDYSIRMQHLGQDGTCVVFVTYEGRKQNGSYVQNDEDNDDVWIKGIVIKRPDLKVTIGRTDGYGCNENGTNTTGYNQNVNVTPFGKGKPYQWNFGTASFNNTKKSDIESKKYNKHDGRTYICGVGPNGEQLIDHLLVYSEADGDVVAFDGRPSNGKHTGYEDDETDNNEHIEFTHPTKYATNFSTNRRETFPVVSNALKVNVTGSGWFTIACSAPKGPVKMKVLSSTNGGTAFVNVLREFTVDTKNLPNSETNWQVYRVYLKAHLEKNGTEGFWDGADKANDDHNDPEQTQMSLYIVYEGEDNSQLNIHYLQWINEMPADYVFQREENPALLNSLQSIKSNGTDEKPGLYWQAGTRMTEGKKSSTSKTQDYVDSAYDSAGQDATEGGQSSGWGKVSTDLGCTWNVAAKAHTIAHTEENYATPGKTYSDFNLAYDAAKAKDQSPDYSDKNLEFAIPMSGSFLRFMPMKNQFISAWVVPEEGKTTNIFVLDETGKPIPFISGADMQDGNKSKVTQDAREHGWIHAASGAITDSYGNVIINSDNSFSADGTTSLRIDFAALASKEYFIVSNDGTISLARLQATGNAYRAGVEEIDQAVTLKDNNNNSSIITSAMSGTGRYASEGKAITLQRTFAAGKWASLVLPFSLNEKKFEEIFGVGAKCLNFTRVDKETNTIVFTHHFYNMVVAGRPVFVYPTQEVKDYAFTDVTLSAATVTNTSTNNGDFTFQASYDNSTISKGDLFMNNQNGTNYWTGSNNSYPGMRSFIKNNNNWDFSTGINVTQQQTKAVFLNFDEIMDDEISTSIEEYVRGEFGENAVVVTKSTKAYDLNGRVVAAGADINNLPAGIYIVNGKKFIVK